jgi:hypothetical protein
MTGARVPISVAEIDELLAGTKNAEKSNISLRDVGRLNAVPAAVERYLILRGG